MAACAASPEIPKPEMRSSLPSSFFILEAFDRDLQCPIAQTRFQVGDMEALRAILRSAADEDPELHNIYYPDDDQLAKLIAQFDARFDRSEFKSLDLEVELFRCDRSGEVPYLIHTRYELPLLLEGRKKLARMSHLYPPMTFDGEHRFDQRVNQGLLHREVLIEPFEAPAKGYLGSRTVFYTPKGEEWRIPAHKLIWRACSTGWNETFERLEGMLFGYEDWQNDWWIDDILRRRGAVGGLALCCPVTRTGLRWMEVAGFRALPPIEGPLLTVANYDPDANADVCALLLESIDNAAVVRFNVFGREAAEFIDFHSAGPWEIRAELIGKLNRYLRGSVVVVAHRNDPD
jgi:hypothetical protein